MFDLRLRHLDHVRRYSISTAGDLGWEVRFEEDQRLRRATTYRDWHRVERALAQFEREIFELRAKGWQEAH